MKNYSIRKIAGLLMVFALLIQGLSAQVKNDAIAAFNASVELMKTNPSGSIPSFENCIKICEQVGDSAYDIQLKAEQVLPGLYLQKASNLLTIDKKVEESLVVAKQTLTVAEKYNNARVKENTQKIMIQAYSNMASAFVTAKNYDKAIQAFDSVLQINPEHLSSIYNKAMMYRTLDNSAKFGETIDLYISKITPAGDSVNIEKANKIARDYYRIAGGKAIQAKKLTEAFDLLTKAARYGTDKNVYYQFASVYNKQKNFAKAVENAQNGLALETGTADEKAKYYFELAEAQFNLGKSTEACEAYKNAKYGQFVQAADAQLKNLKCQ
jgi:tetratricopeptide (TPR) repeat protein